MIFLNDRLKCTLHLAVPMPFAKNQKRLTNRRAIVVEVKNISLKFPKTSANFSRAVVKNVRIM
jgi:hypothetical protein